MTDFWSIQACSWWCIISQVDFRNYPLPKLFLPQYIRNCAIYSL